MSMDSYEQYISRHHRKGTTPQMIMYWSMHYYWSILGHCLALECGFRSTGCSCHLYTIRMLIRISDQPVLAWQSKSMVSCHTCIKRPSWPDYLCWICTWHLSWHWKFKSKTTADVYRCPYHD